MLDRTVVSDKAPSPDLAAVPGSRRVWPLVSLAAALLALAVSAIEPHDYPTWFAETMWGMIGIVVVVSLWRRFPLTTLVCGLLALHVTVLAVGGHWTYAKVPLGEWLADVFGADRNPYDRLAHFVQGFVPALLVREILIRRSPLRGSRWLPPITVCVCLAISAAWEMLEWAGAMAFGSGADDFLGAQGDVWDPQWDMFLALCGAITALLLLSRYHDRQLERLEPHFERG